MDLQDNDRNLLVQFIEKLAEEVRQAIPSRSGGTAAMVTTEYEEKSGTIFAPYWINVFETGRKPGTMPPVAPLKEWIESVGLVGRKKVPAGAKHEGAEMSSESLAWAIATNMKENGNTLWRLLHGGRVSYTPIRIEFDKIFSKDRIDSFANTFADSYEKIITSGITLR